jgi:hypothetical protein
MCNGRFLEVTYLSPGDAFAMTEECYAEYVVTETFRKTEFGRLHVKVIGHELPFAFMSDDDLVYVLYN